MKDNFVNFKQAVELKQLGFNDPCFTYYKNGELSDNLELVTNSEMHNVNNEVNEYIAAPLFQQVFEWAQKEHDIYIEINNIHTPSREVDIIIAFLKQEK